MASLQGANTWFGGNACWNCACNWSGCVPTLNEAVVLNGGTASVYCNLSRNDTTITGGALLDLVGSILDVGVTCDGTLILNNGHLNATRLRAGYGGDATINMTNGATMDIAELLVLGRINCSSATLNIDGCGTRVSTPIVYGAFGETAQTVGFLNVTNGGFLEVTNKLILSNDQACKTFGLGTLTISGDCSVITAVTLIGGRGTGTFNMDGGTVNIGTFVGCVACVGTNHLYFNGTTIKPTSDCSNYISGFDTMEIKSGGVIFDTNGFNITLTEGFTTDTSGNDFIIRGTGSLTIGTDDLIPDTADLDMNGGTLIFGSGITQKVNDLTLTEDSTITLLSDGGNNTLTIDGTLNFTAGKTLTLNGWQGNVAGGSAGTDGRLLCRKNRLRSCRQHRQCRDQLQRRDQHRL